MPLPRALKHEMKQKTTRGVKKGGKKPMVRQSKKHDPFPAMVEGGQGSAALSR